MSTNKQICYVCRQEGENFREMSLVHERVGLGSITSIYLCPKHYDAFKRGEDIMAMEKRNHARFIRSLNCGIREEYE